jgi:hypothetical protein
VRTNSKFTVKALTYIIQSNFTILASFQQDVYFHPNDSVEIELRKIPKELAWGINTSLANSGIIAELKSKFFEYNRQPKYDLKFRNLLSLQENEFISLISKNNRCVSVLRYEGRSHYRDSFYVEIRNVENNVQSTYKLPSLGFEGADVVQPLDNGVELIQYGDENSRLDLYKWDENKREGNYIGNLMPRGYPDFQVLDFFLDEDSRSLQLVAYGDKNPSRDNIRVILEKMNPDRKLVWKLQIPEQRLESKLSVDPQYYFCSFTCRDREGHHFLYRVVSINE